MKTIIYTFGRFQPPTTGHQCLIDKILETARANNADHRIYLSHTQNSKTDPLDWNFKRRICEVAFPGVNISKSLDVRNPFIALEQLSESYDKVILVVGSDQMNDFSSNMPKYAKALNIDFEVISAGQRIAESNGIDGMSASKLRKYAVEGNEEKFFEGLPNTINSSIKRLIYKNTKLGIKEGKK